MTVNYEGFYKKPGYVFMELKPKLALNGFETNQDYGLQEKFEITRNVVTNYGMLEAYASL